MRRGKRRAQTDEFRNWMMRNELDLQELGERLRRLGERLGVSASSIEEGLRKARLDRTNARLPDRERRSELRLEEAIRVERARGLAYVESYAANARRELGLP